MAVGKFELGVRNILINLGFLILILQLGYIFGFRLLRTRRICHEFMILVSPISYFFCVFIMKIFNLTLLIEGSCASKASEENEGECQSTLSPSNYYTLVT